MKHLFVVAMALLTLCSPLFAQETSDQNATANAISTQGKTYQPNVRGSLLFAVGLNILNDAPEPFGLKTWGSKSVNLYYMYDINIGSSAFSFHPGIGLGLEKYQIEGGSTLAYQTAGDAETLVLANLQDVYGSGNFKKNRLAANYIDLPLEFSWVSNKSNPKGGLKVTLGGKAGVLYGSHMKMKYTVGEENRKEKIKRDWNLNPFRYSAHARVGISSFNLYFEYQLSPLFDAGDAPTYITGEGPTQVENTVPEDLGNWRVGLAIDLF